MLSIFSQSEIFSPCSNVPKSFTTAEKGLFREEEQPTKNYTLAIEPALEKQFLQRSLVKVPGVEKELVCPVVSALPTFCKLYGMYFLLNRICHIYLCI